jgi:eukaryotic-like serine/threonine-protein kinase
VSRGTQCPGLGTPHPATRPQALARFQREAQAASALKDSNICTIYDVGEQDGQAFIVMEFLDAKTLKHRIEGKPLPVEGVLAIGIQVVQVLELVGLEVP